MPKQAIILEDVEHATHLTKDKHTGTFGSHRMKEFVKYDHLARVIDDMLVGGIWGTRFL
jgi:hypothetical protein